MLRLQVLDFGDGTLMTQVVFGVLTPEMEGRHQREATHTTLQASLQSHYLSPISNDLFQFHFIVCARHEQLNQSAVFFAFQAPTECDKLNAQSLQ